jgi:hypothetical protein
MSSGLSYSLPVTLVILDIVLCCLRLVDANRVVVFATGAAPARLLVLGGPEVRALQHGPAGGVIVSSKPCPCCLPQ